MTSTVFVTGADGFVGSALCPHLEQHGYTVRRSVQPRSDVAPPEQTDIVAADIGPETDWGDALTHVDAVIHLAARVHVLRETDPDPLAAFRRVNTAGTERLARSAAEQGVKRFVFISTIGVNGSSTPADQPFTEQSPVAPHSPYAQSKWEAEQVLHQIAAEIGLEVVIVRPPLVYGPGVPGNFLRLLKLTHRGLPLPFGNIKNRRSFISRTNLASFLHTCIEHPDAAGETYLVSDGEDVSTPDLVRRIARHLERPAYLFPVPESLIRLGGRMLGKEHTIEQLWGSLVVDSSKARQELDWSPPVSMDEELRLTAEWFGEWVKRHAD